MKPGKLNFQINQGSTFNRTLRWGQPGSFAIAISSISVGSPAEITTAGNHILPDVPWPILVAAKFNPLGAEPLMATKTGPTTLTVPVSTIVEKPFKGPGQIAYNPPVDLTGFTARMQIRASVGAEETLLELTTSNGGINIQVEGLISLTITAEQTEAVDWLSAVYDLELVSPAGLVTRLVEGEISVSKEVTR